MVDGLVIGTYAGRMQIIFFPEAKKLIDPKEDSGLYCFANAIAIDTPRLLMKGIGFGQLCKWSLSRIFVKVRVWIVEGRRR